MFVHGKICDSDPSKGLYKVNFKDLDIVSAWLPRGLLNFKDNKDEAHFDNDEHVICIMDEYYEDGVILCAINDKNNVPVVGNKDIRRTTFKDGTYIEHDRQNKKYTINSAGKVVVTAATDVEITCTNLKVSGDVQVTGKLDVTKDIKTSTGNITASVGNIKATVGDVQAVTHSLSNHVHTGVTSGFSSTGLPTP